MLKKLKKVTSEDKDLFCSIHAFLNLVMELNEELFSFRNPMSPEFTITLNQFIKSLKQMNCAYSRCTLEGDYK